jgi:hypothetical protein
MGGWEGDRGREKTRSVVCPNIHHINSNIQPTEMLNFTDSDVINYSNNRCLVV